MWKEIDKEIICIKMELADKTLKDEIKLRQK